MARYLVRKKKWINSLAGPPPPKKGAGGMTTKSRNNRQQQNSLPIQGKIFK